MKELDAGVNNDGTDARDGTATSSTDRDVTVYVKATDPSGAATEQRVIITIKDINDAPTFFTAGLTDAQKKALMERTVVENATGEGLNVGGAYNAADDDASDDTEDKPLTYAVTGAENKRVRIHHRQRRTTDGDGSVTASDGEYALGLLRFKSSPNHEEKSSYAITITASDDSRPPGVGKLNVKVTVDNADDAGDVEFTAREPQVGKQVVANLTDEDGKLSDLTWKWYRNAQAGTATTDLAAVTTDCVAATTELCELDNTGPTYTPVKEDAPTADNDAAHLAVLVTYKDGHLDTQNRASRVTQKKVQKAEPDNTAPAFAADQDPFQSGNQADAARSVAENAKETNVGDAVSATDTDTDALVYSLGGADADSFTVTSGLKFSAATGNTAVEGGQIQTKAGLDYETKDSYTVVVTATDPSGASDTLTVNITVTDANDKAVISGDKAISYAENGTDAVATYTATDQDGDTLTWGVAGDDAATFEISDAGALSFKKSPSFEAKGDEDGDNIYMVTVTASGGTPSNTAEHKVEVTVTDVDEAGKVTLDDPQPQVGSSVEADGPEDPDVPVTDTKWQWSRGATKDGDFTDIAKATNDSRTPTADDVGKYLKATVTYTDKHGSGKSVSAVSENTVEARPAANAAPVFKDEDTSTGATGTQSNRAVDEGVKGANVGAAVSATDADNDVLLYTITAGGASNDGKGNGGTQDLEAIKKLFSIDPRTGQLKTKVDTLNSDDDGNTGTDDTHTPKEAQYTLTVTATDPSGADDSTVVTVTINDTNDTPKFPDPDTSESTNLKAISVDENVTAATAVLSTYNAGDDDAGDDVSASELTYAVTGADASDFFIGNGVDTADEGTSVDAFEARGALTFKKSPNFEKKSSYSITVTAADDEKATGKVNVKVTVNNRDDEGSIGLSAREPQVGTQVVAKLTDEDDSLSKVLWQWYRDSDESPDTPTGECSASTTTDCKLKGATSAAYTPVVADAGNYLSVEESSTSTGS